MSRVIFVNYLSDFQKNNIALNFTKVSCGNKHEKRVFHRPTLFNKTR